MVQSLQELGPHASVLITDSPTVANAGDAAGFSELVCIPPPSDPVPAPDLGRTICAQLFAEAAERLDDPAVQLIWVHLDSLMTRWDAPLSLRGRWADEPDDLSPEPAEGDEPSTNDATDDLAEYDGILENLDTAREYDGEEDDDDDSFDNLNREPPSRSIKTDVVPPCLTDLKDYDPDEILAWVHLYADQISIVDDCLESLLEVIRKGDDCLIAIAGVSGMAMGEHQVLGPSIGPPLSPRTHLPLWIRSNLGLADNQPLGIRSAQMTQPADLGVTVAHWLLPAKSYPTGRNLLEDAAPDNWTKDDSDSIALTLSGSTLAIRQGRWHGVCDSSGAVQLFLKPDDRFDVNDVASRARRDLR